jgi:hypothetical protein
MQRLSACARPTQQIATVARRASFHFILPLVQKVGSIVSEAHLHRYLAETDFKYNTRSEDDRLF